MRHIIGIDVASEVSSVSVLTEHGKLAMSSRVATSEANLRHLVKSFKAPCQVVFEECGQAAWLYSVLEPLCDDVFVCNPKKNKNLSGNAKTDDNDAFNLAERARIGALSRVWHGGKSFQAMRESVRDYQSLTSESTSLKNRIKAVFRNRGISVGNRAYNPESRKEATQLLPQEVLRSRVQRLGEVLDVVTVQRELARVDMIIRAKQNTMFKSLVSIPQIGIVLAAYIIAEVGSPERFRTRKQFWSYSGLAVITHESSQFYSDIQGQIKRKNRQAITRGLVKSYNHSLKFAFKHIALNLSLRDWGKEFKRLQKSGVSIANARLTLARKASAVALHLMKTGELYDEKLVFADK